jgi:hypothetical protein
MELVLRSTYMEICRQQKNPLPKETYREKRTITDTLFINLYNYLFIFNYIIFKPSKNTYMMKGNSDIFEKMAKKVPYSCSIELSNFFPRLFWENENWTKKMSIFEKGQ